MVWLSFVYAECRKFLFLGISGTLYTMKDSIFTNLFQDKKYLISLYRALHPEDTKTRIYKQVAGKYKLEENDAEAWVQRY